MRLGLVKHRVGETLDMAEVRRCLAAGMSQARAAQFLGVHWDTLDRVARAHGLRFARRYHHYGWTGRER